MRQAVECSKPDSVEPSGAAKSSLGIPQGNVNNSAFIA